MINIKSLYILESIPFNRWIENHSVKTIISYVLILILR